MAGLLPLPYHPRALVILDIQLDDAIGTWVQVKAVPRSVEWHRNTARKADEAFIELDGKDFPFDPRLLAQAHVAVHVEDALVANLPLLPTRLNLRFLGNVDEPETTRSVDGEKVKLECRDYTAVYMGYPWTACVAGPVKVISTLPGVPLLTIVEGIRLLITPDTLPTVMLAPSGAKAVPFLASGRKSYVGRDRTENAWDVISGLCDLHGLVPSWDLDLLTIRSATQNTGLTTAFMVYGHNVSSLKFKRNLQHPKEDKGIRVTAWNPLTGTSLSVTWNGAAPIPPAPGTTKATSKTGKPRPAKEKVVEYHVEGPYTQPDLLDIAKAIHDELHHHKLEGEIETMDMADASGVPLLGLKNGDRLICQLAPEAVSNIAGMSPGQAVAFLSDPRRTNAMDPVVATALVNAWTQVQALSVTFYVTEAIHKWDRENGYKLTIRFSEFVLGV